MDFQFANVTAPPDGELIGQQEEVEIQTTMETCMGCGGPANLKLVPREGDHTSEMYICSDCWDPIVSWAKNEKAILEDDPQAALET
jgi:hypothetical protein